MRRLEDLPLWLFALLTVAGFNVIALGGLVCTRRFGQSLGLYTFIDNDTVGAIFSAILVMYAISLGLIAVASWGNASAAAAAASEEASHIATVYRTLGGYPQPLQDNLKDSGVRYTQSIIEKAWPPHCFSTANFIVDFRTLALSDRSRANTTVRVAVTEPSFPSTMVSICTTSEPSFSHRFALWESNSAKCWRSMPRLAFCGTSAVKSGSSISRKAGPSRTKTETELPRFQSIAVTANALESGLHSTPLI